MVNTERNATRGVVYCLTAEKYVDEAERSLRSLRRHDAGIPVVLCVSEELRELNWAGELCAEIKVLDCVTRSFVDKIHAMQSCGFERMLYLDTDIYVAGPVQDLLDLLDDYDIAASHAPVRLNYPEYERQQLSEIIPQLNTGVLAMRHDSEFLNEWRQEQDRFARWIDQEERSIVRVYPDQIGFRLALHKRRDIRFLVLPPEFNLRPLQSFSGQPRLIHDRKFLLMSEAKQKRIFGWMSRPTAGDPRGPNPGHMHPKVAFLYPRSLLRRVFNAFRHSRGRVIDL